MPRKLSYIASAVSLVIALLANAASAAVNNNILVNLEEPFETFPATGISTIRGWAVGPAGIDRVELHIDGVFKKNIPYKGPRGDVCNAYPSYPDCDLSGFAMAMNFNLLGAGQHTIKVKAIAPNGDYRESSRTIEVQSFHFQYTDNDNALVLGASTLSAIGNDLVVRNAYVDGQPYDLTLRWNKKTQAPELYAIDNASSSSTLQVAGSWDMFSEMDASDCDSGKEASRQEMIFTQSGNTVNFDGEVTGTLVGARLTLTENHSDGGESIALTWVIDFNNDATFLQGAGYWIWTSNGSTCEGVTSLLGRRIQ